MIRRLFKRKRKSREKTDVVIPQANLSKNLRMDPLSLITVDRGARISASPEHDVPDAPKTPESEVLEVPEIPEAAEAPKSSAIHEVRSMRDNERLKYMDLQEDDSIRLLALDPGEENDPVSCHLFLTSLAKGLKYEAISYVWGDPIARVDIRVNGKLLGVTPNLRDVLKQVRSRTESRLVWVDGVCIDQENTQERGHQVRLMAALYQNAQSVLICLGRDEAGQEREAAKTIDT